MQVEEYLSEARTIHRELAVLSAKHVEMLDAPGGGCEHADLSSVISRQQILLLRLTQIDALVSHPGR